MSFDPRHVTRFPPIVKRNLRSFGVIWIRISDPRSLGLWCIKGTDESTLVTDSSVLLMNNDLSDLGLGHPKPFATPFLPMLTEIFIYVR